MKICRKQSLRNAQAASELHTSRIFQRVKRLFYTSKGMARLSMWPKWQEEMDVGTEQEGVAEVVKHYTAVDIEHKQLSRSGRCRWPLRWSRMVWLLGLSKIT